ncbi:MAG TPA: hypothetical protein VLK59_11505 [Solirubrobacteraceae bacterium]|nr:hypothetical protein [Solirubrobacteraceae bacterium]
MHATADQHRRTSRPGDVAEDLAVLVVMLSGAILVVALIVAAFVI